MAARASICSAISAQSTSCRAVCTRIVTYQLPIARFAAGYIQSVIGHRWMQDWIAGAPEEDWILQQYEQPAAGLKVQAEPQRGRVQG